MTLDVEVLQALVTADPRDAWRLIIDNVVKIATEALSASNACSQVVKRDRMIGVLDHYLSNCGWDLWRAFGTSVERTSDRLVRWWSEPYTAKAVLILDGLSLRELPWIVDGAKERGYHVHDVIATASELPGTTNEFARALGFGSRSQLQNNGGGLSHKLQVTRTECVDMAWKDCAALIDASPNWIFWHPWPDSKLHSGAGAGHGLDSLTRDAVEQLTSDDFWGLVERLATGRRLIITSDHGYAATGNFPDATGDVGQFLKATFASGRGQPGVAAAGPFMPPVGMQIVSPHGPHLLAVGRWKWKSQGGYPTLTHGGLSLLEVLSPFVEITR